MSDAETSMEDMYEEPVIDKHMFSPNKPFMNKTNLKTLVGYMISKPAFSVKNKGLRNTITPCCPLHIVLKCYSVTSVLP